MIEVSQTCAPSVTRERCIKFEYTFEHWVLGLPHTTDSIIVSSSLTIYAPVLIISSSHGPLPGTLEAFHLLAKLPYESDMWGSFVTDQCRRTKGLTVSVRGQHGL